MKRLYYLSPSIDSVDQVSKDLHEHGITDWNFHSISTNEEGLYSHHLHSASALQRTDFVRFGERGLLSGGMIGLFFLIPFTYIAEFSFNAWLVITVFSMFFGAWFGGVGGLNTEHYKIQKFHEQIIEGQHLILVDVNRKDEQRIKCIMEIRHPEAVLQGSSSAITNPFSKDDAEHISAKS